MCVRVCAFIVYIVTSVGSFACVHEIEIFLLCLIVPLVFLCRHGVQWDASGPRWGTFAVAVPRNYVYAKQYVALVTSDGFLCHCWSLVACSVGVSCSFV
jgi:hypothetical protein